MIGQPKTGSSDQIIFVTLFSSGCTALLRKTIFLSQTNKRWLFFESDFNVHGHILSTGGDALSFDDGRCSPSAYICSFFR